MRTKTHLSSDYPIYDLNKLDFMGSRRFVYKNKQLFITRNQGKRHALIGKDLIASD